MAVNFTPNLKPYSGQGKFRYWVQMVLPTIYDDSLSYMELLNKVVYVINLAIEDVGAVEENVASLLNAFNELQQFTNDYFDNLDVQEEINTKLDEMVSDGTFAEILQPLIQNYQNQLDLLEARVDNLTQAITPGSTSGDAEVIDIRTGYNGKIYPNAGDAVRGQIDDVISMTDNEVTNRELDIKYSLLDFADINDGVSLRYYQGRPIQFGWVDSSGIVHTTNDSIAYTDFIPVTAGDYITSTGIRNDGIRFVAAYDNNKNIVPAAGSDNIIYSYKVPSNISYLKLTLFTDNINDYNTLPQIKIKSAAGYYSIKEIENVTELKDAKFNVIKDVTAIDFGWVNKDGGTRADSEQILAYSNFIKVDVGDIIKSNNPVRTNIRFVAAYDYKQDIIPSAGTDNITPSYIVPEGVDYVILTLYVLTPQDLTTMPSITITKNGEYVLPIVDDTLTSSVYPPPAKMLGAIYDDVLKQKSITKHGSLNNEKWEFEENHISNGKILSFSGTINTFNILQLGHGVSDSESNYIKIDSTNVYEYLGGNIIHTYPHNLTIQNNIQVEILIKNQTSYNAYLKLISSGNVFEQIMPNWYGDSGKIFVESVGSDLTNCSFGWTSLNYNKPVFIYGDSYLGYATTNRWAYYLIDDGYYQLIDGFAGRNSAWALKSFKANLTHATPKYVLWCMGMNDPDTDTINTTWLQSIEEMIEICENNNITPILATIPNVTNPAKNNTYKNQWVKNSGYRYVDFASAVGGIEQGSQWYPEMLNQDGTHPNVKGAIALYHQVLADFPEITISE